MSASEAGKNALKIAMIGAGCVNFGHQMGPWDHASRLERMPFIQIVAIVDIDNSKAKQVLQERKDSQYAAVYASCLLFSTVEELLKHSPLPDVAVVGVPPDCRGSLQKPMELLLVNAGIHCFVEKPVSVVPLTDFLSYADSIVKAQKEKHVYVSVGYMFRYHDAITKVKQLISEHGGKVMALNARYTFAYSENDHQFWWNIDRSGGPIVEQATHFCDLARFIVGDIDLASIQTTCLREPDIGGAGVLSKVVAGCEDKIPPERKVPRVTMSQWRFLKGGVGSLMHTISLHGKRYEANIDIHMDGLRINLQEPYTNQCFVRVRRSGDGKDEVFHFDAVDPYYAELHDFIKAVTDRNEEGIRSSYADAAKTYEFTRAIVSAEKRSCQKC